MTQPVTNQSDGRWGLPHLPSDWTVEDTKHVGPFVTGAHFRRPDGRLVAWTSRRHRKQSFSGVDGAPGERRRPSPGCWAMAGLFAAGSICFALGSLPLYFDAVDPTVVGATFFGGSVLFTSASAIQYLESRSAPDALGEDVSRRPLLQRLFGVAPTNLGWWAATIQLVGTLLFNLSTFAAMQTDFDTQQDRRLVWAPDVLGSVCFLLASWIAFVEVAPGGGLHPDGSTGWRISMVNLVGSVAFGVSAVAARYVWSTGDIANLVIVNAATFIGALCFLGGALLLPVEAGETPTSS